ncbi:bifunctional 23S rRNA (guanine(2069)-N(7))-methyltransferase RlmK/23S rRNA (guanine(2445)-N(2))-methyltransferase RlmL [Microbulbifer halophilus]|uniref:Ribosomal RNA large subunit methyltransferase K/L n=1 Tax=Microbulbifer halophilus TaxID=453963 RepID=A0ABW5EJZ9_9GAMM|nr:bifunctional 23S rRNA (guanine(2069)-N(7))-methyltransferase RlmK/23S rRNA (guanine(2445)-N(2))-methyltransferase RlmL [Microbulbifer halophilus]MCW8128346.1 bifunctional 23S rRNA (guanine(2069)-N(7))-methyltransferase RlmK/23S rRNA (guanine(2445)-N(2))-methyltransferase RlmL [Microbulbifer halophilus]
MTDVTSAELAFTATCPKGLEGLLAAELHDLGASGLREQPASVRFAGSLELAYRCCLWSRLANRILLRLVQARIGDAEDLYRAVAALPWEEHISPAAKLWLQFSGTNRAIRNSQFGAQKAKDAIVDRLRHQSGARPLVDKHHPDLTVALRLHRDKLDIAIDLSGESLHKRGYRTHIGAAPLKENLAAALLLRAGWPEIAERGGALLDPMCGSGTILIEGAMMAADYAPGLLRDGFGFERWLNHQSDIWLRLREEALERRRAGLERSLPEIRGYDADARVLFAAEANIARAGLERQVRVSCRPVAAFKVPSHRPVKPGLVLSNPPYGERLGEQEALRGTYDELGRQLKAGFAGWQVGIFTGNPELGFATGLRSHKRYQLYNGSIPSQLLLFEVHARSGEDEEATDSAPQLPAEVEMVANRLRKNLRTTGKWAKKNGIDCYRLYDADLPEYAAAVDLYRTLEGNLFAHVQEYRAPASIPEDKARARLRHLVRAVQTVLEIPQRNISIKERRRQSHKGGDQYRKGEGEGQSLWVDEYGAQLEVNLRAYLDTGLFLDHRPVRRYLRGQMRERGRGARFLNLFCYTGTATVQAALGGCEQSTSVDMSKTYQSWSARNFRRNNLDPYRHQLVEADCLQWLESAQQNRRGHYDLIFLDPPSFSNSAKMRGVLDIQRDHGRLIRQCMALLAPGGTLVFSNNLRSFRMDEDIQGEFSVEKLSLLDKDFQRNPKIHNVWKIQG